MTRAPFSTEKASLNKSFSHPYPYEEVKHPFPVYQIRRGSMDLPNPRILSSRINYEFQGQHPRSCLSPPYCHQHYSCNHCSRELSHSSVAYLPMITCSQPPVPCSVLPQFAQHCMNSSAPACSKSLLEGPSNLHFQETIATTPPATPINGCDLKHSINPLSPVHFTPSMQSKFAIHSSPPPGVSSRKSSRINLTMEQRASLLQSFNKNRRPSREERTHLAKKTQLPVRTVQIWFQNRRARTQDSDCSGEEEQDLTSNATNASSPSLIAAWNTPTPSSSPLTPTMSPPATQNHLNPAPDSGDQISNGFFGATRQELDNRNTLLSVSSTPKFRWHIVSPPVASIHATSTHNTSANLIERSVTVQVSQDCHFRPWE